MQELLNSQVVWAGVIGLMFLVVTLIEIQSQKDLEAKCPTCGGGDLKRSSKPSWLTLKNNEYFCYKCQRYFSKR